MLLDFPELLTQRLSIKLHSQIVHRVLYNSTYATNQNTYEPTGRVGENLHANILTRQIFYLTVERNANAENWIWPNQVLCNVRWHRPAKS